MPFIRRYSGVKKGGIVFTGNTLGLSKAANATAPGTEGSIGAFISTDLTLQAGAFPAGTTLDYTKNSSRAVLSLPDGDKLEGNADSNIVNTEILTYSVPKVKSSDKTFLQEGETAQQTVSVTNNSAAKLFDILFRDTMTDGASHEPGSVVVNGVARPTYDPVAGFALPDLDPGESATVQYAVRANNPRTSVTVNNSATLNYSVDDPVRGTTPFEEDTNTVELALVSNRISVVKSVDKAFAVRGDTLHYTSVITNTGSLDKTELVFTDEIPAGTSFTAGSVKIDGVAYPAYNPQTGFSLPDLAEGEEVKVEFDVTVN